LKLKVHRAIKEKAKSSSSVEKSLEETKRSEKDPATKASHLVVSNGSEERTNTASNNQLLNVSVKERVKKWTTEDTRKKLNSAQFSLDSSESNVTSGSNVTNGSNRNVPFPFSNIPPFPNNDNDGYEKKVHFSLQINYRLIDDLSQYNRLVARYGELAVKHKRVDDEYYNYKISSSNQRIHMQYELNKIHELLLQNERNVSILTKENKRITLQVSELLKQKSDLMKKDSDRIEEKKVLIENARQSEQNLQRSHLMELEKMQKENLATIKKDDQIEKLLMKEREMKRFMENLKEDKRGLIKQNELLVEECHMIKRSLIDKDERLYNMQSFSDDLERKIGRQAEEKTILSLQLTNLQFEYQLLGKKCDKLSEQKPTKTIEIQTTIIDEQSKTIAIQTELEEKDNSQFLTSKCCQTMEISTKNNWTETQIQMRDNWTVTEIQMTNNRTEIKLPNKIPSFDTIPSLIDTRNPTVNIITGNNSLPTTLNRNMSPKTVDGQVQTDDISVTPDESFIRLLSQTEISKDEVKIHTINEEKLSNSSTSSLKRENLTEKEVGHIKEFLPVKNLDVMKENNGGQVFIITRENVNDIESWIRRCSDLERQNLFLEMETETIGEYITKYHKMRQLLKKKYQSKDQELKIFRKETEVVQSSPTIEEMSHVLEIHKRLEAESDSRY
ncbi:hypothetical protein SNEBB_007391, partial [Seison nebaliae]